MATNAVGATADAGNSSAKLQPRPKPSKRGADREAPRQGGLESRAFDGRSQATRERRLNRDAYKARFDKSQRPGEMEAPYQLFKAAKSMLGGSLRLSPIRAKFMIGNTAYNKMRPISTPERAVWAEKMWEAYARRDDFEPRPEHIIELLDVYFACHHTFAVHEFERVLDQLQTSPKDGVPALVLNAIQEEMVFRRLVDAYARHGYINDCRRLITTYFPSQYDSNLATALVTAHCFHRDFLGAMATITGSGAIYVDPYLKLLIEVSKVGDVEMAREILRMMSNQGLEMDDVTARLLARAYGVNGQTNEMSKILTEQYAKNGGLDPALEMGFFSAWLNGTEEEKDRALLAFGTESPGLTTVVTLVEAFRARSDAGGVAALLDRLFSYSPASRAVAVDKNIWVPAFEVFIKTADAPRGMKTFDRIVNAAEFEADPTLFELATKLLCAYCAEHVDDPLPAGRGWKDGLVVDNVALRLDKRWRERVYRWRNKLSMNTHENPALNSNSGAATAVGCAEHKYFHYWIPPPQQLKLATFKLQAWQDVKHQTLLSRLSEPDQHLSERKFKKVRFTQPVDLLEVKLTSLKQQLRSLFGSVQHTFSSSTGDNIGVGKVAKLVESTTAVLEGYRPEVESELANAPPVNFSLEVVDTYLAAAEAAIAVGMDPGRADSMVTAALASSLRVCHVMHPELLLAKIKSYTRRSKFASTCESWTTNVDWAREGLKALDEHVKLQPGVILPEQLSLLYTVCPSDASPAAWALELLRFGRAANCALYPDEAATAIENCIKSADATLACAAIDEVAARMVKMAELDWAILLARALIVGGEDFMTELLQRLAVNDAAPPIESILAAVNTAQSEKVLTDLTDAYDSLVAVDRRQVRGQNSQSHPAHAWMVSFHRLLQYIGSSGVPMSSDLSNALLNSHETKTVSLDVYMTIFSEHFGEGNVPPALAKRVMIAMTREPFRTDYKDRWWFRSKFGAPSLAWFESGAIKCSLEDWNNFFKSLPSRLQHFSYLKVLVPLVKEAGAGPRELASLYRRLGMSDEIMSTLTSAEHPDEIKGAVSELALSICDEIGRLRGQTAKGTSGRFYLNEHKKKVIDRIKNEQLTQLVTRLESHPSAVSEETVVDLCTTLMAVPNLRHSGRQLFERFVVDKDGSAAVAARNMGKLQSVFNYFISSGSVRGHLQMAEHINDEMERLGGSTESARFENRVALLECARYAATGEGAEQAGAIGAMEDMRYKLQADFPRLCRDNFWRVEGLMLEALCKALIRCYDGRGANQAAISDKAFWVERVSDQLDLLEYRTQNSGECHDISNNGAVLLVASLLRSGEADRCIKWISQAPNAVMHSALSYACDVLLFYKRNTRHGKLFREPGIKGDGQKLDVLHRAFECRSEVHAVLAVKILQYLAETGAAAADFERFVVLLASKPMAKVVEATTEGGNSAKARFGKGLAASGFVADSSGRAVVPELDLLRVQREAIARAARTGGTLSQTDREWLKGELGSLDHGSKTAVRTVESLLGNLKGFAATGVFRSSEGAASERKALASE